MGRSGSVLRRLAGIVTAGGRRFSAAVGLALLLACGGCSRAGSLSAAGHPLQLRVGYQPYYAEAWSAAILRGERLYANVLPAGTKVGFRVANRGVVLERELLQGRIQMAYLGDVPAAMAAASGQAVVIAAPALSMNQCSVLLVAPDAPPTAAAVLHWMDGRRVAVPRGSCSDAFLGYLIERAHIRPAAVYDLAPDTIGQAFRSHLLDAAVVWQPAAAAMVAAGVARVALTGAEVHWRDGAFLVARKDLLRRHPGAVVGWLRAERAAETLLADPAQRDAALRAIGAQAVGYTPAVLGQVYAGLHAAGGIEPVFTLTPQARAVLAQARRFLVGEGRLPEGSVLAIDDRWARRAQRLPPAVRP